MPAAVTAMAPMVTAMMAIATTGANTMAATAALASPAHAPAACRAVALALTTDARDGAFDGMSHSGTLLVLRNRGPAACTLPGLPRLTFQDAGGHALPVARRAPAGMHPGPVVLPVTLAPGAAVSTPLRWVSGPVFAASRCLAVARVSVAIGGGAVRAPLTAQMCGEGDKPVPIEQPPLRPGTAF